MRVLPTLMAVFSFFLLNPSYGSEVSFKGSFLDLLVELDMNGGLTIGLDPFELQNEDITKSRFFKSLSGQSAEDFVRREAEKLNLKLIKDKTGAYYATSEMAAERDKRLTLFKERNYDKLAKITAPGDPLVHIAKLILQAHTHSQSRIAETDKAAATLRRAYPALETQLRKVKNYRGSVPQDEFIKLYRGVENAQSLTENQVGKIDADYNRYLKAKDNGEVYSSLIYDYGSLALGTRAYLEHMIYLLKPVTHGISMMEPYHGSFSAENSKTVNLLKPGSFQSRFKPEIISDLAVRDKEIKELGRAINAGLKQQKALADDAVALWKTGKYREAFEKISEVLDGGDFSSRTRALHGLFFTKAGSEFIQSFKAKANSSGRKTIQLQPMAGVDKEFEVHLSAAGVNVTGFPPDPRNPGRTGACYGLTVSQDEGQVSTFGIQVRPRSLPLLTAASFPAARAKLR